VSRRSIRPEIGEDARVSLIDCGEPVPALLGVFERTDATEGCFDEGSQGWRSRVAYWLDPPFSGAAYT
jgi:hypothetical protein